METVRRGGNKTPLKRKRKQLKEAISQSKARYFQALCDAADRQPFGTAYKMVMGKLRRQPTPTSPHQLENIVRTLFPQQAPFDDQHSYPPESADIALTDAEEALAITAKVKTQKAPGPDGIPNCAIKAFIAAHPEAFVSLYNECLVERTHHLELAGQKVAIATTAISRLMANNNGPRQMRRKLIASVVMSIILYGCTIWAPAVEVTSYSRGCKSSYRRCALRVATCFRTVSEDAAFVIAGMAPLSLLAAERQRSIPPNRLMREETLQKWQRAWDQSANGRWTQGRHGQMDFYLAQIMTGHGCFKVYLHRFKHERNPYCDSCGHVIEDAEHVAFHCPSFGREREQALAPNTRFTPDNFVAILTESEEGWAAIFRMAASIMKKLRRQERLRREQEALAVRNTADIRPVK
ncbi:hypothetical protein ACLKA7_000218 [Drosophila subpalustris]